MGGGSGRHDMHNLRTHRRLTGVMDTLHVEGNTYRGDAGDGTLAGT